MELTQLVKTVKVKNIYRFLSGFDYTLFEYDKKQQLNKLLLIMIFILNN